MTTLATSALNLALRDVGGGLVFDGGRTTTLLGGGSAKPFHKFTGLLGRRGSILICRRDELSGAATLQECRVRRQARECLENLKRGRVLTPAR